MTRLSAARQPAIHRIRAQFGKGGSSENPLGESLVRVVEQLVNTLQGIQDSARNRKSEPVRVQLHNSESSRWDNNSTTLKIAATLDGTSANSPLHIMNHTPPVEGIVGEKLMVAPHEVMPALGEAPIQGVQEYRPRLGDKPSIASEYRISTTGQGHISGWQSNVIPQQYQVWNDEESLISWSSPEELADITNDYLRFVQAVLNNFLAKGVTLYDVTKMQSSVQDAYRLLAENRVRNMADFTPEFLQRVIATTDTFMKYLKDNNGAIKHAALKKCKNAEINAIKKSAQNLRIPCKLDDIRYPSFYDGLLQYEEQFSIYYSQLYTRTQKEGMKLVMLDGSKVEDFDIKNPQHFFALIRAIVDPVVTDHAIKYRYKHQVNGMYDLLPHIPQPPRRS